MVMRRIMVVGVLLLLASLAVVDRWGSRPAEETLTPGYEERVRTIDTSPFTFPQDDSSVTTLAPGYFRPTVPRGVTTTSPDQATTTTEPDLYLPPTGSIRSVCGMSVSVVSLFPAGDISGEEVGPRLDRILPNLLAYVSVAPEEIKPDVVSVREVLVRLSDLFKEGKNDLSYKPLADEIQKLIANQPPYDDLPDDLKAIQAYEDASC